MRSELEVARLASRLLSVLLALDIAKNFISPALWILGENSSVISTTARLASNPHALAVVWFLASLMVAPYVLVQLFAPLCSFKRLATKWACRGVCLGGVIWVYLAYLSKNLDYDIATTLFIFNGVSSVALGAVLAFGLNSDQLQAEHKEVFS